MPRFAVVLLVLVVLLAAAILVAGRQRVVEGGGVPTLASSRASELASSLRPANLRVEAAPSFEAVRAMCGEACSH